MDLFKHLDIDLENDTLAMVFEKLNEKGIGNCSVTLGNDKTDFAMLLFVTEQEFMPFFLISIQDFDQFKEENERRCRVCGCTQNNACPGGCWWVEDDLCSACAEKNGENS